jgi:hypothetical protein
MDEKHIRTKAKALDDAIEKGVIEDILPFFAPGCQLELFGVQLQGHQGLQKALKWMSKYLTDIKLTPIVIMIDGHIFFEEFTVDANTPNGKQVQIKQAEVLEYDSEYKVKSLRLYFDRLLLAKESVTNVFDKWLINRIIRSSISGLE